MIRFSMILLFSWQAIFAQNNTSAYKKSTMQLGLFPGMSTNGINPGEYDNIFSLNIFTGFGHSTSYFELNGLAGFNTASSTGIHISGFANYIGGNNQVGLTEKQKRQERRLGYETNLSGFQISGVMNFVGTNVFGAQVTLGVNNVANYLIGFQFAGLFNYVGGFTMGTQVSAIGNYSKKSMSGVQLSLFFNSTQGSYSGIQLGFYNHAGIIMPTKGPEASKNTALQVGIVNASGDMGGWQIGFLNIGDRVAGTQIGIINIFKSAKSADYKDGPAFGLLNLGYFINPRVYVSELFIGNYGLYSGKPLNTRVRSATRSVYSYNETIYSTNHSQSNNINWGVSYRFGLISFYKSVDVTSQRNYFSFTGEFGHYNRNKKFDKELNMRYAIQAEIGFKLAKKASFIYPFVALSYNFMPNGEVINSEVLASSIGSSLLWPGYSFGIMIH